MRSDLKGVMGGKPDAEKHGLYDLELANGRVYVKMAR